ncbi:MAG: hypothetical protein Q9195_009566 [Heterodermia aff. obscurata]
MAMPQIRRLQAILKDDGIAEVVAKQHLKYSWELALVEQGFVSYSYAIRRAFSRKQALALGRPYSVVTLGYGTSFVYKGGFLCYLAGTRIRILDVLYNRVEEKVIDMSFLLKIVELQERIGRFPNDLDILDFNSGLVSLSFGHGNNTLVLFFEIDRLDDDGRKLITIAPWSPKISVARTDQDFIVTAKYTGTAVALLGQPRHEWQIRYTKRRLHGSSPSSYDPFSNVLQLRNFFGVDIGQTVVFELIDGYFYAVSNQSTFEVEEVDWTSYYHCWRIDLQRESESPRLHKRYSIRHMRVWRRQHREGIINDNWTDLSLHKDEKTGIVTIVEARKEYLDNSSDAVRTFYTQPLLFDDAQDSNVVEVFSSPTMVIVEPNANTMTSPLAALQSTGDVLTRTLEKGDLPNYEEAPKRIPSNYHVEPPPAADTLRPLASTYKFRTYVPSSAASLDLVQSTGKHDPSFRISSRYLDSPIDPETQLLRRPIYDEKYGKTIMDSELAYINRPTVVWPPPNARSLLKELHVPLLAPIKPADFPHLPVLNPHCEGTPTPTRAMADSRSLVYMSGAPHESLGQAITMVNFDRFINFERPMPSSELARTLGFTFKNAETDIEVEQLRRNMDAWRNAVLDRSPVKMAAWDGEPVSWMWIEKSWACRGVGGEYIV